MEREQDSERDRDAEYETRLDDLVDELFNEASRYWTWPELAHEAGLAYSTVYNLGERVTRLPQLRTVYRLADALGMDVQVVKRRLAVKRGAA